MTFASARTYFLIIALLVVFHGLAFAQQAQVRVSVPDQNSKWVGQRILLVVELFAPGFFASAPTFDLPDPPGMLLMPPVGSPVLRSDTIGEVAFTVQRHELSVFAQRPGEQTIPPLTVRFQFKRNPLDHDVIAASVTTSPVKFSTKLPPGADNLGSLISARNLTVEEIWRPDSHNAKVGDCFIRTITFTAPEIPAMAFPEFPIEKIDGLGIYPKSPEILDQSDRGNILGKRRDTITYVCQRPGQFIFPAARMSWFDLDSQQLQTINLPTRTITVTPDPAIAGSALTNPTSNWRRVIIISLGGVIGFGLVIFVIWKSRRFFFRLIKIFHPIHLALLNPDD